jgi:hypothetical protein
MLIAVLKRYSRIFLVFCASVCSLLKKSRLNYEGERGISINIILWFLEILEERNSLSISINLNALRYLGIPARWCSTPHTAPPTLHFSLDPAGDSNAGSARHAPSKFKSI